MTAAVSRVSRSPLVAACALALVLGAGCGTESTDPDVEGSAGTEGSAAVADAPLAEADQGPRSGATAAPGADALLDDLEDWQRGTTEDGLCDVAWRSDPAPLPRNVACSLDVQLLRDGAPLAGARLEVRGWMPDHGHGLVREPTVIDQGDGRFRVDNLLLHMRGLWDLDFLVTEGTVGDRARFEVTL